MAASDNDIIDYDVFGQLLDMDEDGDNEFSKSIVYNYFEQAETTFKDMDKSLDAKDLPEMSRLGHYLKGSSAALGLKKVKAICEHVQHYGTLKDSSGINPISEKDALDNIESCLKSVKEEFKTAKSYLMAFYEEGGEEEEEDADNEIAKGNGNYEYEEKKEEIKEDEKNESAEAKTDDNESKKDRSILENNTKSATPVSSA